MKDATVLVVAKPHQGDSAVDNVVRYMVESPFADRDEILSNGIHIDSTQTMIEDFYRPQAPLDMDQHRRVFHMVLTTGNSKAKDDILENGANALLDYFAMLGHQVLLVPHYGSRDDFANHHYHAAINPISYKNGQRMLDKFETYNNIVAYLNQNTQSHWGWKFTGSKSNHSKF